MRGHDLLPKLGQLFRDGPELQGGRMAWIYLIGAGLLEVVWAYFMKQSHGFTRLAPSIITVATMLVSFGMLGIAMRTLPLGTAYGIWTGVGAIGAFLVGVVVLGEPINAMRVIAASLIICGLVLLKMATPD